MIELSECKGPTVEQVLADPAGLVKRFGQLRRCLVNPLGAGWIGAMLETQRQLLAPLAELAADDAAQSMDLIAKTFKPEQKVVPGIFHQMRGLKPDDYHQN